MTNIPKLQVTGYRGIWGESLNEEIVEKFGKAFVLYTKEDTKKDNPTILIGRDGRENGIQIANILLKVLQENGVEVVDGDILPTPTIIFAVSKYKYDGAIIITASHNPKEYNGLKFVTNKALLTNESQVEIIKKYYE